MSVMELTNDNFAKEVTEADKPVLVDFFATWCGPCKMMTPIIDQLAAENEGVKVVKVDIDKSPSLAAAYGVTGVPTIILFKGGQAAASSVGAVPKAKLEAMIKDA